jgi:ABC-type lipoprotein export system ATPase subunit
LVMVTHDPQISERAERRIILHDGLVIEDTAAATPMVVTEANCDS